MKEKGATAVADRYERPPDFLKVKEVAQRLGVSVRSVWRLAALGEIPRPVGIGGSSRWPRVHIEHYVEQKTAAAEWEPSKA